MDLLTSKLVSVAVILVIAAFGVFLPQWKRAPRRFLIGGNAFSGGVLLSTALCHLLSDASDDFDAAEGWDNFPWPLFLTGVGYMFLTVVEITFGGGDHDHHILNHSESGTRGKETEKSLNPSLRTHLLYSTDLSSVHGFDSMKLEIPGDKSSTSSFSVASEIALSLALIIHSLLEGLAVGAQTTTANVLVLCLAIGLHKGFAGFALGSALREANVRGAVLLLSSLGFLLASPIGVGIGIAVGFAGDGIAPAFLSAISAGTLLYVAVNEIFPLVWKDRSMHRSIPLCLALIGYGGMSALAIWA